MDKRTDISQLFYDLSEESIIDCWDNCTIENEEHEFSQNYKTFRENLIRKVDEGEYDDCKHDTSDLGKIIPFNKNRIERGWKKRFPGVTAAAILATVIIFSMGVYALVHFYDVIFTERDQGKYVYEIEAQYELQLQPVRLILNYVPEGYELSLAQGEEESDGIKKYRRVNGEGGFSVFVNSYYEIKEEGLASEIEHVEIGGVPAIIFTVNGDAVEYNHRIELHYTDIGQVVSIYGQRDVALEELKKVAENLEIEIIEGETYEAFVEENNSYVDPLGIKKGIITEETIVPIGTTVNLDEIRSIKVMDIELMDNISSLPEAHFRYDMSKYQNEDGTFKTYDQIDTAWEDNAWVTKKTGTGHIGFAYITLEIANLTNEPLEEQFVWATIGYRNVETNHQESAQLDGIQNEISLNEPVYYDSTDPTDDPNIHTDFISDFEAGETRTVHLGVLYLKERQDEAYISLRDWIGHLDDCYVKLIQ